MSNGIALNQIAQVHISVRDIDRAVEFYRDTLGMRLLFEVPGQSMAFFECGGIRLYLGVPEGEGLRSNPLIYYRVDAIEDAYARLMERGVESVAEPHVVHATDAHELWTAGIRDPEGNPVFLMSEVALSEMPRTDPRGRA
jgi:catechol 2,3-dioxygenase-like lactoylglutathione lyase family enzyme